jgi:hypothetical protein
MTLINGIQDRGIKQQLPLGGEGTLNGALRQEVIELTARSFIWLKKMNDKATWRSRPLPTRKKRLQTAYVLAL